MTLDFYNKAANSAPQCRAARALVDWIQDQLAENAQVARATIADFERNIRTSMRQNLLSIISTLEAAGVAFIAEDAAGGGIRFRKIELEYNKTVRPAEDDIIIDVRYKGKPYTVVIFRSVIDDIDHTSYGTTIERVKTVQNHLPMFLRAAEEKIIHGIFSNQDRVLLNSDVFPDGTF